MNQKIDIKSFSALAYAPVVRRSETRDLVLPRLSPPRLHITPDSVRGWKVQPKRLTLAEPLEARPGFDKAPNAQRGEGTENPGMRCLSHGCQTSNSPSGAHLPAPPANPPALQSAPRVDLL
jgi:hypothetical protein